MSYVVERALENPEAWNIEEDPGISIAIRVGDAGQSNYILKCYGMTLLF